MSLLEAEREGSDSELATLHHTHHALDIAIFALGIVATGEAVAKAEGDGLIHIGLEGTDESLCDFISRLATFAVDEFHQQAAL